MSNRWKIAIILGLSVLAVWSLLLITFQPAQDSADKTPESASLSADNLGLDIPGGISKEEVVAQVFNHEIAFYGRVIDEAGAPVSGVRIEYSVYDSLTNHKAALTIGPETDVDGNFEIRGKKGASIYVQASHPDYHQTKDSRVRTSYAFARSAPPSLQAPTLLRLKRKGETASLTKVSAMRHSFSSHEINSVKMGSNVLHVNVWYDRSKGEDKFTWGYEINVPSGGLLEYTDAQDFQAPESGYSASIRREMSAMSAEWDSLDEKRYFIKLPDETYARFRWRVSVGGDPFWGISGFHNPSGSGNLEPAPE